MAGTPRPDKYGNLFPVAPNGLPMARIPLAAQKALDHGDKNRLTGKMIYFYDKVMKKNRHWQSDPRILIIASTKILVLNGKEVSRVFKVKDIEEIVVDSRSADTKMMVGIKFPNHPNRTMPDLVVVATGPKQQQQIIKILQTLRPDIATRDVRDSVTGEEMEETLVRKVKNTGVVPKDSPFPLEAQKDYLPQLQDAAAAAGAQPGPGGPNGSPPPGNQQYAATPQDAVADYRSHISPEVSKVFDSTQQTLVQNLISYKEQELQNAQADVETYLSMIDERDREIEALKASYTSLTDNPEFWRSCPKCLSAATDHALNLTAPDVLQRQALERQLTDYKQLIHHLQMTRSGASGIQRLVASTEITTLESEVEGLGDQVRQLHRLIIENPYPTEDVRIRAEQIAGFGGAWNHADDTPRLQELESTLQELEREHATRDRELRHARTVMKDAFRRQVDELTAVREQFQQYDEYIVDYLEKVFASNAFPQGAESFGQTPLQIAQATSQAARQAATPGAFPRHTATANMPVRPHSSPYSERTGSRAAASPISTFVPPNVVSEPSVAPPVIPQRTPSRQPLGVEDFSPTPYKSGGRGTAARSIL